MCESCGCGSTAESEKKIADLADFRSRVEATIEKIRPAIQMDGGDLMLVDVSDTGEVQVTLHGACATCPHATMTLKMGIERYLKEEVPEVTTVVSV